ncbi:hypothetical protein B1748_12265 [Paenibacillus sp. MY03]|uniref:MFS transporter n=1 Tax=Paenibacillus sp. MY03 TaxID=302980 RepID=UPI000B3C7766|nr:MFS transporter [Paenibacillus sp. MY03]OUS76450.1 hypothetical protein B1748_12265 [Paenibacillus sp. MY03]
MKVSAPGAARIWQPLRERGFRRLWTGQTLSDLANWLDFVAISTLIVYAWGHGPAEMALYSACVGLPWVVIGPWASVRVRRFRGKTILILCDALRAVIVFVMVWADSLPVLLALVFLKMSVSSVFDPVRQQAVKGLVGAERLAQATSLSGISANLTKIVGPMLGGISALWLGQAAPFVIGASLYALSAAMLAGLPRWGTEARRAERGRGGALRQAIAHLKGRPLLRAGMVYMGLTYALIFVYDNLFAVLAKDAGLREEGFALLIGCVGAGSVAGAIAAGYWDGWRHRPIVRMAQAGLLSGLVLALAGLSGLGWLPANLPGWLLGAALIGYCGSQAAVPFGYLMQTETTEDTIAPMSSLASAVQTSSMLIAPFIGAAAATYWSPGGVFLAAGFVMLTVGGIVWTRGAAPGGKAAFSATEAREKRLTL